MFNPQINFFTLVPLHSNRWLNIFFGPCRSQNKHNMQNNTNSRGKWIIIKCINCVNSTITINPLISLLWNERHNQRSFHILNLHTLPTLFCQLCLMHSTLQDTGVTLARWDFGFHVRVGSQNFCFSFARWAGMLKTLMSNLFGLHLHLNLPSDAFKINK